MHLCLASGSLPCPGGAGLVADRLFPRRSARFFQALGPRSQVALCQLPLTLIVAELAALPLAAR